MTVAWSATTMQYVITSSFVYDVMFQWGTKRQTLEFARWQY